MTSSCKEDTEEQGPSMSSETTVGKKSDAGETLTTSLAAMKTSLSEGEKKSTSVGEIKDAPSCKSEKPAEEKSSVSDLSKGRKAPTMTKIVAGEFDMFNKSLLDENKYLSVGEFSGPLLS